MPDFIPESSVKQRELSERIALEAPIFPKNQFVLPGKISIASRQGYRRVFTKIAKTL